MRLPTAAEIDEYAVRQEIGVQDAWRDYLVLRIAEATSRDPSLRELCVWKGAFVLRFVLGSPRASDDLDATVGTNRDKVDEGRIRKLLLRGCHDLGLRVPKAELEPRDDSLTFDPIEWTAPDVGEIQAAVELSLREDLVLQPRAFRVRSGLLDPFEITHIDLHEQVAEKLRCMEQRSKIPDAYDLHLLWQHRSDFDDDLIRRVVPTKLTSGKDHRAGALEGAERRRAGWENARGAEIPVDAAPAKEVFEACRTAIDHWIR